MSEANVESATMASNTTIMMTTTINSTTVVTTVATTTTTNFNEIPGALLDLHEMCVTDWDEVYDGHSLAPREYTSWNALNIIRVSLCAWIILCHIALIFFVLGKRMLRVNPKNPLIANMAVANMLLAVFVVPVKQDFILNPDRVDCGLEMGWVFIADYFQTSVALFAVLSLVLERFVYVYLHKNQKKILRIALILITVGLLVTPWLLSIVFLLPTYLAAFKAQSIVPNTCLFKVEEDYFLAAQILSFLLPSLGVCILAPYTGLLDCLRPSHCIYESLTPKGESMAVTALISLISIFCEAPYCAIRVLMTRMECNNPYCSRFGQALNIAMWIRVAKAAIFPFIWLFYTDIRRAMLCHLPKSKHDDDDDDDDDFVVDDNTTKLRGMGEPHTHTKEVYPVATASHAFKDPEEVQTEEFYPRPSTSTNIEN